MMPQHIVVMGATGSGKSTFINLVSGSTLDVSDGIRSCTSNVQESRPFTLDDQSVILVDTPGFDDTSRPDTDIITAISTYLANMHRQGVHLAGIVYMHRISDVRIGGASLLNFRIFCHLCGNDSLRNAIILTTMWSRVDPQVGESREQELAAGEDLFKPALDSGALLIRHDGTRECAQAVLRLFAHQRTTLRIQTELVDEGKELVNTAAGTELARLLAEQAGRLDARSKRLLKKLDETSRAQDEEGWTIIRLELDETEAQRRRIEDENKRLRRTAPADVSTDIVRASTEMVKYMMNRPLCSHPQNGAPATSQARTMIREQQPDRSHRGKKRKFENEEPRDDANAVSEVLRNLRMQSAELHDDIRTRHDESALVRRVEGMQRQIDVAIEHQNRLVAEVKKQREGFGRGFSEKMTGWMTWFGLEFFGIE